MPENDIEARIRALERAIGNPGGFNKADAISMRDYFEAKLAALEKATGIAAETMDKRLDGMNEFRDALKDQAGRFVTREELNSQLAIINVSIRDLRTFKDQMEGKASAGSVYLAYGLSVIGLIIGVVSLFR